MSSIYDSLRAWLEQAALAGWLPETLQYAFVANSLLCAIVIGPVLGAVGTMVVTKRLAFFSQAVGHAALTGVAIGILLDEPYTQPYVSMTAFCILFAVTMNFVRNRTRMATDTIIGVFLSISLAIGASLLLFVAAQINVHLLDTILFGSILTVNDTDLNVLLVMALLCWAAGIPFFNKMLLASFNPALADVRGVQVRLLDYVFILMITLLTVASVKIIGAILVEALLLIPAAAARNLSRSVRGFVLLSILFSTISCVVGIIVPIEFEIPIPSGGAIIITSAIIFFVTLIIRIGTQGFREAGVAQ